MVVEDDCRPFERGGEGRLIEGAPAGEMLDCARVRSPRGLSSSSSVSSMAAGEGCEVDLGREFGSSCPYPSLLSSSSAGRGFIGAIFVNTLSLPLLVCCSLCSLFSFSSTTAPSISAVDFLRIVDLRSSTGFSTPSTCIKGFPTTLLFPEAENIEAEGDLDREGRSPAGPDEDPRVKVLLEEKLVLDPPVRSRRLFVSSSSDEAADSDESSSSVDE